MNQMKCISFLLTTLLVTKLSVAQDWADEANRKETAASTTTVSKERDKKLNKINLIYAIMIATGQSGIRGESESYSGPVTNISAGVAIPVTPLSKKTELVAGLRFSKEGSKYKSSEYIPGGNSQSVENKVVFSYLRMPVFVRTKTNSGFYGAAGLQPGLLLSAKDRHNGQSTNIKTDYNSFDMGLMIGAGYDFKNGLGACIHFYPGISNINKKGGPNDDKKDQNQTIAVGLQYKL
jgi:Outer membrane protein beta-barrel domain